MKINRTKNAARNIVFGVALKIYQIAIPFLMRTAMIYFMGVQYLGLNSLFASILEVLNLVELGVGNAMVFSMYKPIVDDDKDRICALMKLYKVYYRVIGLIIAVAGLVLLPFIPRLIHSDLPSGLNIYILYLLNLSATVLSYWLFAYKNSLLQAHQRNDVTSKVTLVTVTLQYAMQLVVLIFIKNYYLYVMVALFTQALTNIITAIVVTKLYPNYKPQGKLDKETIKDINHRIRDLFTAKLGTVMLGSVDTIVISSCLGLTVLAVYQNYFFVMNSIYGLVGIVFGSVVAGIGNSIIIESIDKNYCDFNKFTFIVSWIICVCCTCFIGLYQPFMKLWVGDDLTLPFTYVIFFCVYFYVCELAMVWATIKDATGLWHTDRFRPLIGAIVNLILNIILVQYIGLYGILLSTIISYVLVSMPWLLHNLFKYIYKRDKKQYIKSLISYLIITILSCTLTYFVCLKIHISGIARIIIILIICILISNVLQFVVFRNKDEFKQSVILVKKMLSRK